MPNKKSKNSVNAPPPTVAKSADLKEVARAILPNLDLTGLSLKQKRFVLGYAGNPVDAAEKAGYGSDSLPERKKANLNSAVRSLMNNEKIRSALHTINKGMEFSGVVSSLELRVLISDMIRNEDLDAKTRMMAMKLLSSCYADFAEKHVIEKHETSHTKTEHSIVFENISAGAIGRALGMAPEINLIEGIEIEEVLEVEDLL